MLSPIRTVLIHYPIRSFLTIVTMAALDVYMFQRIKKKYDKGLISEKKGIVFWFLLTYIMLLLFFTVIGRRSWDYYRYNMDLGYSYQEVLLTHDWDLVLQIISNIMVFVPIGMMSSYLVKRVALLKPMLLGGIISFSIEISQLVLKRGYCELDDIISNLIGTLIGSLLVMFYRFWVKKIKSENATLDQF